MSDTPRFFRTRDDSRKGIKHISGITYNSYISDYNGFPMLATGEDQTNTVTDITYGSNGKPSEIKKYRLDYKTGDKAQVLAFEYNDTMFPDKPTKITITSEDI
jgi:hypothetical protein